MDDLYNEINVIELRKLNKEIKSLRQGFFDIDDFDPKIFKQFINNLGYNIDIKSENYKIGYKYYNRFCKPAWNTSDNNKNITKQVYLYNRLKFQDEPEEKTKPAFLYNSYIESHCCQKSKYLRKKNIYYSALRNDELWVKKYETAFQNIQQMSNKIYGSTIKTNSGYLWFDIDNHCDNFGNYKLENPIIRFKKILKLLDINQNDILYIEENITNKGIHFIINTPYKFKKQESYQKIENILKENKITGVDCNFYNRIMRFPLSYEYRAVKEFKNNKAIYYKSFSQLLKKDFNKITYSDVLCELFSTKSNINFENITEKKKLNNKNYWSKRRTIISKKTYTSNSFNDNIKLTSHNRYYNMGKIISHFASLQKTDEEIAYEILNRNISSNDIAKWSFDDLIKNVHNFADKCRKNPTKTSFNPNHLVSNDCNIPDYISVLFDDILFKKHITRIFMSNYQQERKKHNSSFSFSDSKKHNLLIQIPYIVKQVIGSYYYQLKEKDNKLNRYVNQNFKQYNGFQLSDTYLKLLINESNNLKNIDKDNCGLSVQYTKKAILKLLSFIEINLNKKKNWCNGFCKSHVLCEEFIIKKIFKLYEAIKGKKLNHLFYIYRKYILLKGNTSVLSFNSDFYNLNDKKIKIEAPPD